MSIIKSHWLQDSGKKRVLIIFERFFWKAVYISWKLECCLVYLLHLVHEDSSAKVITVPWAPKWYFDFRLAPLSLLSLQCCISPLPRLHLLLQAHFCSESKYLYLYRREKGPHSREKTKQVIKFTELWIWNSTRDKKQFVLCKSSKSSSSYLNVQCPWKLNSGHNFRITKNREMILVHWPSTSS